MPHRSETPKYSLSAPFESPQILRLPLVPPLDMGLQIHPPILHGITAPWRTISIGATKMAVASTIELP